MTGAYPCIPIRQVTINESCDILSHGLPAASSYKLPRLLARPLIKQSVSLKS